MLNTVYSKNTILVCRLLLFLCCFGGGTLSVFGQEEPETELPYPIKKDNTYPYSSLEDDQTTLRLDPPESLQTEIIYNPETGEYEVREKIGTFDVRDPFSLSQSEYNEYRSKQDKKNYWDEKRVAEKEESQGDDEEAGGDIFGSNVVDIKPQGSAELTFGMKISTVRNPMQEKRYQTTANFDFNNKIRMNVTGQVGDKLSLTMKYDTESQFEFDKKMKLEYTGDEDEIIKKFELGNVSFPSQNSLITGSLSSFGFKSELQFGKLYVTSVFARQQGEFSSISVDGGAQKQDFEVRADEYDRNRHYFLGHFFRDKFEGAFETTPAVSSGVVIEKIEVWVQQRIPGKENERDILALSALGEYENTVSGDYIPSNVSTNGNQGDPLYYDLKDDASVRDVNSVSSLMESKGLRSGTDYKVVAKAVPLKTTQYTINQRLGFISLNSPLDDDDILAVAVRYSYKGQTYEIGEFSSEVDSGKVVMLKMLKSSNADPKNELIWDLMMKNVYSIGGYQISGDDFILDVMYEDDATGIPINYLKEGKIANTPLISVLNLDNLTYDHQPYSDGMFDYIDGVTVYPRNGRVIFPLLEPFGKTIVDSLGNALAEKYAYTELYDSSWSKARQVAEKNKFLITGEYKSSVSSEIPLNRTQISEGSVIVTAGGRKLIEDSDYTVDYSMGRVKIINDGLLESGTPIKISFENDPVFNTQTKSILGSRFEYRFNENFNTGLTVVKLSEVPMYSKVSFQDFPVNNTMWGLDGTYSTKSQFLTTLVDKLPLIETKAESNISLGAEFAELIPSHSKAINDAIEIDYFENTQHDISVKEAGSWVLASIPADPQLFPESRLQNNLESGMNRAHLSWYRIHQYFHKNNNVSDEVSESNYSRGVYEKNIFQNKDLGTAYSNPAPMQMLNLAYYPNERGMYNYDTERIDPSTGLLTNPESRWGGVMRHITTNDFEEANVEFIDFWLMDPFTEEFEGNSGGDLYINLGMVSEDILKDSRQTFEQTLENDPEYLDTTAYARVSTQSIVTPSFNNEIDRPIQDVGFDGLSNEDEQDFFKNYIDQLSSRITDEDVLNKYINDPSSDDFVSYLENKSDLDIPVPDRYKYYNGVDGNSPQGDNEGTGSVDPDVENVDDNYTFSDEESFYQYRISIKPEDLEVGENFITDTIIEKDTETKWYHFKIPINTHLKKRIGGISDFRSVNFMRIFLHNFEDPVILRFAEMDLVRSDWRKYDKAILEEGEYDIVEATDFDVSVVNIEENASKTPVNYVLPPDVERVADNTGSNIQLLNEQSLSMKLTDLDDGYGKAVYKSINKDFRQFGKVEMYAHAEEIIGGQPLENGDVNAFIRIGSDYTNNYYEYEVPLEVTQPMVNDLKDEEAKSEAVWPLSNNFVIDFEDLIALKDERNDLMLDDPDWNISFTYTKKLADGKIVRVKGNPNLGNVKTMMLGVKNPKRSTTSPQDDGASKSCEIWFNELRLTEFDEESSWAATASARFNLADLATVSLAGKTSKPGFGSIDQKIFERSQEDLYQYDFATNVALDKFAPEQFGLVVPFYYGISETFINPLYNPLNPDKEWSATIADMDSPEERSEFKKMTQDYTKRMSYNFTNVRMMPKDWKLHPFSIGTISATYGFSRFETHNVDKRYEFQDKYKAALKYNYTFKSKPVEPFKKVFKSKKLALIRDFNFYYTPTNWAFTNQWNRTYQEAERRNVVSYREEDRLTPTFSKKFEWSRKYDFNYAITKSLKFNFSATNLARVDEPAGIIQREDQDELDRYREEMWENFWEYGRNTQYKHNFGLKWKAPTKKIKLLDWTGFSYKYNATYNWDLGPEFNTGDRVLGNIIKNTNTQNYDATFSFTKLYSKNKYLKSVSRLGRKSKRSKSKTETVKYNSDNIDLKKGKPFTITHKLGTEDVKVNMVSSKGSLIKGKTEVISSNKVRFIPNTDSKGARLVVTGKKVKKDNLAKRITDRTFYTLMLVKNVSFNYSINAGTVLPGYLNGTEILGQTDPFNQNSLMAPGWHFISGGQDTAFGATALYNNWITNDEKMDQRFAMTNNQKMRFKASLEPIKSFRITLTSDWSYSENFEQLINASEQTQNTQKLTKGNYSRSFNTFKTAFDDDVFEQFLDIRPDVARKLSEQNGLPINENTGYSDLYNLLSQEVLLHSFRAAYTGDNVNEMPFEFFPGLFESGKDFLKSMNWRVSYSGLSRLKFFKKRFKSFSINHAYSSKHGIGSFETNWLDSTVISNYGRLDVIGDGVYEYPSNWDVSATTISERFSPLIGVNMKMKNNVSIKLEMRKTRNLSLSFVNQKINEVSSDEFVLGIGYLIKKVPITFFTPNSKSKHKSDLNIKADFSIRDNVTQMHDINTERANIISKQKMYTLKSYADYDMTKRFNIRLFYDHIINDPFPGYRSSNVYFGMTFRFSLS